MLPAINSEKEIRREQTGRMTMSRQTTGKIKVASKVESQF